MLSEMANIIYFSSSNLPPGMGLSQNSDNELGEKPNADKTV